MSELKIESLKPDYAEELAQLQRICLPTPGEEASDNWSTLIVRDKPDYHAEG